MLAVLEDAPPAALELLAAGLDLANPPLDSFAIAVINLAVDREHGEPPSARRALRLAARDPGLAEKRESAETAFWSRVREAIEALRDDELETIAAG
jgi:hypothetical protein